MKLSRSQKKFLKKNLRKLSLVEIAQKLDIEEKSLQEYLKSIWSKERYKQFLTKQKKIRSQAKGWRQPLEAPRGSLQDRLFKKKWPALVFLAFLVFAVYFNSLGNEFVSDDIPAILKNENLGNPFFWIKNQTINSLRYFFYFLIYKIGGKNPVLFRLLDVFFHLGSVLVIYTLISLLYTVSLAFIVATLFAVHPILSEAVVWISGGVHAQYVFFVLLSFLFYLKARLHHWNKKYYFASVLCFLCALLTTEKAAILPLIIFSFELSVSQLSKSWRKTVPFFLLSGAGALFVIFGGSLGQRITILQAQYFHEGGFHNPLEQIPVAIGSYLSLIFWPDKLTIYHSEMMFNLVQYLFMVLVTLILLGVTVDTFINKKYRTYFFWLSFFIISLLPMLTPFKVAWIVAERYVYLGALGIFVIVGFGLQKIGEIMGTQKITYVILGIILLALSIRTIKRNQDWKNQDTLWLAGAKTSPSSAQNHNNLGDLYARQGDLEKAAEEFKKAIELKPAYADAYHNLANTYEQMGRLEEAFENFQKALEFNPNLWQSHQSLAAIYFKQGELALALKELEEALKINPEDPELYNNLGVVYFKLEERGKAQEFFQKALELDPENQRAKQLLTL